MAQKRLDKGETPRAMRLIDNAMEGAQRAAQLTARLLAFSRQQPLEPQAIDVNKLVGGMSEMLRRTIGDDIRIETVLAGGLWRDLRRSGPARKRDPQPVRQRPRRDARRRQADRRDRQCHLDEAYAAAHPEATAGQYIMVSVTDTGVGMPPEVAERAFDPFYTTKGPGKGQGSASARSTASSSSRGGHVKIYSEPGHGTTVKLYLPRHHGEAAQDADAGRRSGERPSLPRAEGEIVLVVEDDDRVRHVSVDALRELGYTVMQAPDAHQALAMLATPSRIDLLFTDVVMPDINGRQLAEQARAARPELKVLYTTGYTRNAIVHNGMLDPGVDCSPKPFTVDQLARKVRQVLDDWTSRLGGAPARAGLRFRAHAAMLPAIPTTGEH